MQCVPNRQSPSPTRRPHRPSWLWVGTPEPRGRLTAPDLRGAAPPPGLPWRSADPQSVKADAIWTPFRCCHWAFPTFCSNLDFPHSEDLRFQGPLLFSLPFATFRRPHPSSLRDACPHRAQAGSSGPSPEDGVVLERMMEKPRNWGRGVETVLRKHPGDSIQCPSSNPGKTWVEWERISRISGLLLSPQDRGHHSESGWLSPLGSLLLELRADSLHLLTSPPHLSVTVVLAQEKELKSGSLESMSQKMEESVCVHYSPTLGTVKDTAPLDSSRAVCFLHPQSSVVAKKSSVPFADILFMAPLLPLAYTTGSSLYTLISELHSGYIDHLKLLFFKSWVGFPAPHQSFLPWFHLSSVPLCRRERLNFS